MQVIEYYLQKGMGALMQATHATIVKEERFLKLLY